MTAAQAAEFASLAYSGIPTAYTRAWQDHDGGLKLLSSLLHRAVEGLRTSPTGKWVEASYKLVDVSDSDLKASIKFGTDMSSDLHIASQKDLPEVAGVGHI